VVGGKKWEEVKTSPEEGQERVPGKSFRMMKVPPLSLVGMERLPLPLPFSPELLWRYNPMGPGSHSAGPPPSPSAAAAAAGALSNSIRAAAAASSMPYPLSTQLPFAYDIKHTIPIALGKFILIN
jgi:hypothetical protein